MSKVLRINFLSFVFIISLKSQAIAQSEVISYARTIIDTLTSKTMNGRGYVDSGDWKAAAFIGMEMRTMGLEKFGLRFYQLFRTDVNTFPEKLNVSVNEHKLIPGKDFLVDASSAGIIGSFKTQKINVITDTSIRAIENLINKMKGKNIREKFIVWNKDEFTKEQYKLWRKDLVEKNCFGARGYVEFTSDKLTWTVSEAAEDYCGLQIRDSTRFSKKKKIKLNIEIDQLLKKEYPTNNVIGYIKGTTVPDSFIVFTAHYDHLGQMGDDAYFPGANDNASGVSMLLNLARYYQARPSEYSVAFIAFSGEELGLLGSGYYVENPMFPLDKIKFLINLDIVGTGDDGIKVVNATEFPAQFDQLVKVNEKQSYVKQISPRGKAANSDHYPFYMKGVPCFFIYTLGGISAYHDIYDRPETLPLTDYEDLFKLLIDFTSSLN